MNKFRYKRIFAYTSLQFCGNIEEYFAKNSEEFIAFLVMPRVKNKFNLVRVYKSGKLISETKVKSFSNIFLYYSKWYFDYLKILFNYGKSKVPLIVIAGHPISFFGMTLQKVIFNVLYVQFVGDYFPGNSFFIRIYEGIKKMYHNKVSYAYYLSDGINKVMNGKIVKSENRKTIMWGVKPTKSTNKSIKNLTLLFVGLIKESQGLEFLFNYLKENKSFKLNIIGICDDKLYAKYKKQVRDYNLAKQVYFPNTFYSDEDLKSLATNCHVGIALYNTDKSNPTYYTDPGKVKSYAEMGLPVIMTNVSGIAQYVKKFNSGILINRSSAELESALNEMKLNYSKYRDGLKLFNQYFNYMSYYKKSFKFLESI